MCIFGRLHVVQNNVSRPDKPYKSDGVFQIELLINKHIHHEKSFRTFGVDQIHKISYIPIHMYPVLQFMSKYFTLHICF